MEEDVRTAGTRGSGDTHLGKDAADHLSCGPTLPHREEEED